MTSQPNLLPLSPKTFRIAWFENGDILGGAELFSLDMLANIDIDPKKNIRIDVYWSGNNKHFQERLQSIAENASPSITLTSTQIPIPSLSFSIKGISDFIKTTWEIRRLIKTGEYTTCYANTVRTGIILGSILWSLPKSIKSIFMAHDYTFPKKLQNIFLPQYTTLLTCSHPVRHNLIKNSIPPEKIIPIENGIDPQIFRSINPIKFPPRRIGMIGRITRWKGQRTILSAFASLHKIYPEAILSFYGEVDAKEENKVFLSELKKRVQLENLERHVFFEGFTPLPTAMEKIDVLVHASEENEPFGRTPIEGSLAKRILMISNMGTPASIFENNKNAFFFEAGNVSSAQHVLEKILNLNISEGNKVIKNSFTMSSKNFSLEKISKRFWGNIIH